MIKSVLLTMVLTLMGISPLQAQIYPYTGTRLVSPTTEIDYSPLQSLLANQQWREANEKTSELMLKAANRELQGWLSTDDILNLACWDLKIIDDLWQKASGGRFGFTPQYTIFIETGNRPGRLMAVEAYEKFGDTVGWRTSERQSSTGSLDSNSNRMSSQQGWVIFKENIDYSLDAPVGHLPQVRQTYNLTGNRLQFTTLTKRLVDCKIVSSPSKPSVSFPQP